jgi:hypothetical protein
MAVQKQDFNGNSGQKPVSKKRTRITLDVNPDMYLKIKMEALKNHLSVSSFLLNIMAVCQELCKISEPGCFVDADGIVSLWNFKLRMTA